MPYPRCLICSSTEKIQSPVLEFTKEGIDTAMPHILLLEKKSV
jgi:hypothetical protein